MTTWANSSATLTWLGRTLSKLVLPSDAVAVPARKSVIFDFDGTIADSFSRSIEIGNQLAETYGIEPVTPAQLDRWQHMNSKEILSELDLPLLKLPLMLHHFKQAIQAEVVNFPFILGMRETILALWDQDYALGVVTSNSAANVRQFLKHQGMSHLFDFIESCPYYTGKQTTLRRIARKHQLDLDKMLYVGDETRDIDAAKKIRVKSVAVSWGFNSTQKLQSHQPDYLIDRPRELLNIVTQLH